MPPVGAVVDWGDPITKDLYGYWLPNSGGGLYVSNAANPSYKGKMSAEQASYPTWDVSKFGGALSYDGTSAYVFGDIKDTNTNVGTMVAWVYRTATCTAWAGLLSTRTGGSNNSGIIVGPLGTDLRYTWTNSIQYTFDTGLTIPLNTWALCACSVDPATSNIYLIYPGSYNKVSTAYSPAAGDFFHMEFGRDNLSGRLFTGRIAHGAYWARPLLETEIRRLYSEPFAGIYKPRQYRSRAVAFNSAVSFNSAVAGSDPFAVGTSISADVTGVVIPSMTNGLLLVAVASPATPVAPILDPAGLNTSLTLVSGASTTDSGGKKLNYYYLLSPPAGTYTIRLITWTGFNVASGGIQLFSGVHQTTPFGTVVTATGTTPGNPTPQTISTGSAISSSADEVIVGACYVSAAASTLVTNCGATDDAICDDPAGSGNSVTVSHITGSSSFTMTWVDNWTYSTEPYGCMAFAVKQAASGGPIISSQMVKQYYVMP